MHQTLSELLDADTSQMSAEELEAHVGSLRRLQKKDLRQLLADESCGRPEYEGFIYILSNPSMAGILKVGYTSGTVEQRAADLSSPSGVPEAYKIEKAFPVYTSPRAVEKKVHRVLDACRVSRSREFFRLSLEEAVLRIEAAFAGAFDALFHDSAQLRDGGHGGPLHAPPFEMTSTLPLRATHGLVRRRSSCSR
jgi:hypothetical protein